MKRSLLLLLLVVVAAVPQQGKAQLLGGIFSQKETDLKLVGQQIALLQLYIGGLEKGYRIAREGLTEIGDSKKGDLDLHTEYFNAMKTVNPEVKGLKIMARIYAREAKLVMYCHLSRIQEGLSALETDNIQQTTKGLMTASIETISDLSDILKNYALDMTDDDRLKRLQTLEAQSSRRLRVAIKLHYSVATMAEFRLAEQNDIRILQRLNP